MAVTGRLAVMKSNLFGGEAMKHFTVLDGGLSTQLELHGAEIAGVLWTGAALVETPELVEAAHRDFVLAGAEIITTASYQLSRAGFVAAGRTPEEADRALLASVELARRVTKGTGARVAASIGPWGATRHDGSEYLGNYGVSQEFLENFHRERIAVLAHAAPDFFAVETIPEITEARAIAAVLADFSHIPSWFSFTASDDSHLPSGEAIEDAVLAVVSIPNLVAVGVNCVAGEHVQGLATAITTVTSLPVIAYPNKGGHWDPDSAEWQNQGETSLASGAEVWRAAGVRYLGGCCGYDATDIKALRRVLDP